MKLLSDQRPAPPHHRYVMNGQPLNCAYCRELLRGENFRSGDQYYCTELCIGAGPVVTLPQQ
jgi:hypothetical protein